MTAQFTHESEFPYELQARVGEGAMGEVYQAWESALARTVAIKMLRRPLQATHGREAAHRLLQEARSAAALTHPGIAAVYRIGQVDACPYIAMEWLEGHTLDARFERDGPMSVAEAGQLGLELLEILEAVHRAGIVHRDIKPDNIFLTRQGHLKITDFGIARLRGTRRVAMPPTRGAIGTPLYASPEQLRAAHDEVDARSDLYGVGAVLYEALAGRPVIRSRQLLDVFHEVVGEPPTELREVAPHVPEALAAVVMRALSKSPDAREADASAMWRALWQALHPDAAAGVQRPARVVTPSTRPCPNHAAVRRRVEVATHTPAATLDGLVRTWPARTLGVQPPRLVLERLLACPLHVPAFAGAMVVDTSVFLLWEGMLLTAFDSARPGHDADTVLAELPEDARVTLHPCAPELEAHRRIIKHLAALHRTGTMTMRTIDGAGLEVLIRRLMVERFDGHLRVARDDGASAILIFDRGQRVLDLVAPEWPSTPELVAEDERVRWCLGSANVANLPWFTWQTKLVELDFAVGPASRSPRPVCLRADRDPGATLDPARMALRGHHDACPTAELQRWLLDELSRDPDHAALWPSLQAITRIRWHHVPPGGQERFELVTFDANDQVLHVAGRDLATFQLRVTRLTGRPPSQAVSAPDGYALARL